MIIFILKKQIRGGSNKSNSNSSSPTSGTSGSGTYTSGSGSSSSGGLSSSNVPSCRSSKIRPQLNPNARKVVPKSKRCKASALLDQIPVCKLQKTLIKYGCCHNMNVISLDFYEYPNDHCC